MTELKSDDLGCVVRVLFNYKYKANDGRLISIQENDEFVLIKKSNDDWWQVIKQGEKKPIYVPAAYITQLQQKKYPDHPFFKKAFAALEKAKKKQRLSDGKHKSDGRNTPKGRVIMVTGSKEDLTVMSLKDNKYSEMRASCDSLDRFIENENPYDEVPFESTFSPRVKDVDKSSSTKVKEPTNSAADFEEPEYENLENIKPAKVTSTPEPAQRRKSLENIFKSDGSTPNSPDIAPRNISETSTHSHLQGEDATKPSLPQQLSPRYVTTVEY
uniref:SH3 domain-containing protein n=1 Tax=Ciona savignyi TaxID=51511 RepID=H2Z802_CIOSA